MRISQGQSNICFFVSDLHGHEERYRLLFKAIKKEKPQMLFMGGDLLPSGMLSILSSQQVQGNFIQEVLVKGFTGLKRDLGTDYPAVFIILGNDDSKSDEKAFIDAESLGIWKYIHNSRVEYAGYSIYGYSYVPPSPFLLKDFEKYDVSRYVDPGCIAPEEGTFSVEINRELLKIESIKKDLEKLVSEKDLSKAILLFHSPPYQSKLDRADLDGKFYEHVPLDVHIGSIAIQRFIAKKQPLLTLHGHVHESARLTGHWQDRSGKTWMFSAAHDGPELALVRFDLSHLSQAIRELVAS